MGCAILAIRCYGEGWRICYVKKKGHTTFGAMCPSAILPCGHYVRDGISYT